MSDIELIDSHCHLIFENFEKDLDNVFFVKVLTEDLYDLLIRRFLSAICILFFADLLLATDDDWI